MVSFALELAYQELDYRVHILLATFILLRLNTASTGLDFTYNR